MKQRENGIVIGTVVDLDDPEKLGRVRVQLPQYDDQTTYWARIVSPMAGKQRGFFFRPEPEDEVLIGFENGDPRRAYVLGSVWSKIDPPPPRDGNEPQNNLRLIVTRANHIVRFDDTAGAEKIEIIAKGGKQKIVVDPVAGKVTIECSSGDVEVSAPTGTFKVAAKTVDIQATAQATFKGTSGVTIEGATVNIN
jgi:uncharacterized protein involved in type VI secretion and phage assembly